MKGKRENGQIMFSIQEYSNQLFFRVFLKTKSGECRDHCSSMNTILETIMQYPFVKPYCFRISLSSQTSSLYS